MVSWCLIDDWPSMISSRMICNLCAFDGQSENRKWRFTWFQTGDISIQKKIISTNGYRNFACLFACFSGDMALLTAYLLSEVVASNVKISDILNITFFNGSIIFVKISVWPSTTNRESLQLLFGWMFIGCSTNGYLLLVVIPYINQLIWWFLKIRSPPNHSLFHHFWY